MKREHITQSDPLMDFLRAHNCIFYSPLSQTDTTDWISGNAMTPYSANSVVWDSARQMWKFQHVSGQPYNASQYYAKWDLKETLIQTAAQWSAVSQFYAYNLNGVNINYDALPTRLGLSMNGTIYSETESAQVFASDNVSTVQTLWKNGVSVFNYNYGSIINAFNNTTGVRIGCPHNSGSAKTYGMRNFAIFPQGMTITEINQYFALI